MSVATLTTPPARIVRRLILAYGLGGDGGENFPVFTGFLPNTPNDAIAVYDTVGKSDGRIMSTGEQIEHPGIQVRVRSARYEMAWKKSQDIALMLDGESRTTVAVPDDGIYFIQNISRVGSILSLGPEEIGTLRRYDFTVNAVLTLRKL